MKPPRTRVVVAIAAALASIVTVSAVAAPSVQAEPGHGLALGLAKGHAQVALEESSSGSYIVLLSGDPLIVQFGQDQLASPAAKAKGKALAKGHEKLLKAVGVPEANVLASYTNALNGFAAIMSFEQAQALANKAGVAAVYPNELQQPMTDASGDFLGLSGESGVWASKATGDGVLVGIIDSGIWPEHPSLDPNGLQGEKFDPDLRLQPVGVDLDGDDAVDVTFSGCDFGTTTHKLAKELADPEFECNAKLVGARHVMPAYETLTGLSDIEYGSARDEDGHGTHTATTAAGNAGVTATVLGVDRGVVSGIAPDAQVAVYKALGELGGYGSDLALAIDIAVFDQVDVINYSIGSSSFAIGPDDVAFFFATLAGVHVATSNGNSGPGAATIGSPASVPWLTSVGASTHDRTFLGEVTVLAGKPTKKNPSSPAPVSVSGVSITGGSALVPIVDAADLGNELCESTKPFKGRVAGAIVLCKRGANARIDKSFAVYQAGGAGMVLYNTYDADTQITDSHWVPSVHLNNTDGLVVKEYIHSVNKPVAQITGGETASTQGSVMAAFSSRGENLLSGDLIKPDVTAPGVNILAGNTPTPTSGPYGSLFQSISGTSMSSPHVAGLMAQMTEVHPDWTPAMVKSALMTTAHQDVKKEDGVTPADPFDMGAGHVDPPSMFDPGLVYDAGNAFGLGGEVEYAGVGCAVGIEVLYSCAQLESLGFTDASDFNQASIGSGSLPGSQTIVRSVTNVTNATITVSAQFDGLAGVTATMVPSRLTVAPGEIESFEVVLTNESAPLDKWVFGSMTLVSDAYEVYAPIAVRPVKLGVPYEVAGLAGDGGTTVTVEYGYTGNYTPAGHGLVPAGIQQGSVGQDADQTFTPDDAGSGATAHTLTVPAGTAAARIHLPPVANADVDLDLFVFDPDGNLVGVSGNGGTNETVDLMNPMEGDWTFYVHGWSTAGEASVGYGAFTWLISATPGGNLAVVDPGDAALGDTDDLVVSWPMDLPPGEYMGAISHSTDVGIEALTLVSVSAP